MRASFHAVWMHGELLALECKRCGHRGVLDHNTCKHIHRSNMTPLRSVAFRCAKCEATGKGPDHWIMMTPADHEEAKMWLSGYQVGLRLKV